jgi:hypothetical protein
MLSLEELGPDAFGHKYWGHEMHQDKKLWVAVWFAIEMSVSLDHGHMWTKGMISLTLLLK